MTNTSAARPVLNGRYELHRRIARGGMADVFLAKDQLLDRPVAVKVLFPQYAAEPTFVARFRREAQAAANLNHPNIVAVYDWGEHQGTYFIVMEYVEGRTLADIIAAEGPLHPERAADIASEVAVALSFAHRNGTVHRDVKPGNIMITQAGQIKVADFGIARAFGGSDDELTQTGSVMGTATYFSPEQAQGRTVDPRSDLYSLGVVLFEMVVGEPPFLGNTPVAIAYKHVQEPPPRPTSRNPMVPPTMDSIIYRLLQKNLADRYPAAEELRTDLRRFRNGQPLANGSGPVTEPTAAYNAIEYDPTMAMAAGVTTAAMSVRNPDTGSSRALIDTSRAVPASAARAQEEPVEEYYEPPSRTGMFVVMLAALLVGLVGLIYYITNTFGANDDTDVVQVEQEQVPTVVGENATTAKNRLTDAGFEVVIEFEASEDVPPNDVISQDPEGGTMADVGSVITLLVSEAEEQVPVPQVIGMTLDEAQQALLDVGLAFDIQREFSDSVPLDHVIDTDPAVGEDVGKGFRVQLIVSNGPDQLVIPQVAGRSAADATAALQAEGFTNIVQQEQGSATVPAGQVIETAPAAGEPYALDKQIVIYVSSGPQNVVLSDLRGKDPAAAETWLNDNQLAAQIEFVDLQPGDGRIGLVIEQSPQPGQTVQQGSTVVLQVGREGQATTTTSSTTTTQPEQTTTTENTTTTEADNGDGGG